MMAIYVTDILNTITFKVEYLPFVMYHIGSLQVSLQHLPTMQSTGASGEAPRSGPQMLSGLFAKAQTQATGLLAKVRFHISVVLIHVMWDLTLWGEGYITMKRGYAGELCCHDTRERVAKALDSKWLAQAREHNTSSRFVAIEMYATRWHQTGRLTRRRKCMAIDRYRGGKATTERGRCFAVVGHLAK